MDKGIKGIGQSVFSGCENLESIDIPETVTELGTEVFNRCINLRGVNLPKSFDNTIFKKPDNLVQSFNKLSIETAERIEKLWFYQMTVKEWAELYLTQNTKEYENLFIKYMTDKPNKYLSAMIDILKERGNKETFVRAAAFAAEYNKKIDGNIIISLYKLTKKIKGTETALELLDPMVHAKKIEKNNPYAFFYEKFDEAQLLNHYKEHSGKIKALADVKAKDGKENAPQIVALAAIVPYLDEYVKNKIQILPDSDKAAKMLDHNSLINLIKNNTDLENYTEWLYPYCRYASNYEIQELLELRKKKIRNKFLSTIQPVGDLLLSDRKSAIYELYKLRQLLTIQQIPKNWQIF